MKVALIHYRLVARGGLETRLVNYTNYFVARGDEVTIICAKKSDDVKLPPSVHIEMLKPGLIPNPFRKLNFAVLVSKYMKTHAFDFSLSLSRTFSQDAVLAPGNHLGYLLANQKTFKTIDDRTQIYLDRKAFEQTDIIFAASQFMKRELIELYGIDESKIKVLYPPLDTSKFKPALAAEKKAFKIKHRIRNAGTSFLFASTGHKRKGVDLLLQVFKKLDPEKFHLYIAGFPKVKTNLPNVYNLGFREDMMEIYNAVDFTIHPAIYEPFGQIIAESIQCETPVIISDKVGAKEIVTPDMGVVIKGFEHKDWIEKIESLQSHSFFKVEKTIKMDLSIENHMRNMLNIKS